jgi:hypothetical protein
MGCDGNGATLGPIVLIARQASAKSPQYQLESDDKIVEAFTLAFGDLPADELARRFRSLQKVITALNEGDVARAMVHALLMRLPEIPKAGLAKLAGAAHLRKYNPDQPRVPAGNPDGGQWTSGGGNGDTGSSGSGPSTAQAVPLEMPLDLPFPSESVPMPTEILPPPLYPLAPENPYPNDPKCVQEWQDAIAFCQQLLKQGQLGKRPRGSGFGANYNKCLLGQVSERCGGNPTRDEDAGIPTDEGQEEEENV